eukprot:5432456-Pyramimonas_sp.AAC.1
MPGFPSILSSREGLDLRHLDGVRHHLKEVVHDGVLLLQGHLGHWQQHRGDGLHKLTLGHARAAHDLHVVAVPVLHAKTAAPRRMENQ